jgi:hypothetical protein
MPSTPPPLPPASARSAVAAPASVRTQAAPPSDPFAALVAGMAPQARSPSHNDALPFTTAPMSAPPLSFERAPVAPPRQASSSFDTTPLSARPDAIARTPSPPQGAPQPSAPPPPVMPHPSAPPPPVMPSHAPVPIVAPVAPSAPPPPVAPLQPPQASVAPPAEAKKDVQKDDRKPPAIDPKTAILVPLGIFGVFVFLSIVVTIYALIAKPWQKIEDRDAPPVTAPK